jgi:hypothetical protein
VSAGGVPELNAGQPPTCDGSSMTRPVRLITSSTIRTSTGSRAGIVAPARLSTSV